MPLPSFTATGNLREILGDIASGELIESALSQAQVVFVSNVPAEDLVKWSGSLYRVLPVKGRFDSSGSLVNEDGGPLLLLAQDDGLHVRGLQWHVHITIPSRVLPPSASGRIRPWWFNAASDGETLDLQGTAPAPGVKVNRALDGDLAILASQVAALGLIVDDVDTNFVERAQDAIAALLVGASGVSLVYDDAANSLTISGGGDGGLDDEAVRDAIGVALIGAGVIDVVVNDAMDTITITSTATVNATDAALRARSSHTGVQAAATISDLTETVQDIVAALLTEGDNVTLTYDDTAGSLTIAAAGGETGGLDAEGVRDTIGAAMAGSGLISVVVDDTANTITVSTTATANSPDADLLDRANHTGTQTAASISDLTAAVDARIEAGRIPRVATVGSSATPTYDTDDIDALDIVAQTVAITSMTTNHSGTINNFQPFMTRIYSDSVVAIAWGAKFVSGPVALPTATVAGKPLTVRFYGTADGTFSCHAVGSPA